MKKALIIGAAGFVGNYLIDHIQKNCIWSIAVTKMPHEKIEKEGIQVLDLNILDFDATKKLIGDVHPDYIFHLAAQSSVALSWKNPGLTVDVNIKGSLNVLDAVRDLKKESTEGADTAEGEAGFAGWQPRLLLIGSGEEYGHVKPEEVPITEDNVLRPGNIYAATKACTDMIGNIYARGYQMDIMSVRAFNHIGPNQVPIFVVADFCKQVAEIEKGEHEPVMRVGNLSAKRDFTDVRDVVRAYCLLMEKGRPGEAYNIGSGHAVPIQEILDRILAISAETSDIKVDVQVDPARLRLVDVPIIEADITKVKADCGWEPEIGLDTTLRETLKYWRG